MITAKDATIKYSQEGINKVSLSLGKMLFMSIMAGMFIALAGSASTIASATIENPSLAKLVTSLVFPAGLAMVIVNGSELFTGNNLMIISVLDRRISILPMLRNWIVVYLGNILGSFLVTGLFTWGHVYSLFDNAVAKSVINIAATKTDLGFQAEIELKEGDTFNFCFNNGNDIWDNNNGQNYIFPLEKVQNELIVMEDEPVSLGSAKKLRRSYLWSKKIRLAVYKIITYFPKIISGNYYKKKTANSEN